MGFRQCTLIGCIKSVFLITFLLVPIFVASDMSSEDDKELYLTKAEKMAFDKFKGAVQRMNITQDYMKQDILLLRWIRAKNLNVHVAIEDMRRFIDFSKRNRLDTILNQDFSDMTTELPFYSDAVDRWHRPVGYASIGTTGGNIRRIILQGKRERLGRYYLKVVFELFMKVYETSKTYHNVTQFSGVLNLEGFNTVEHSCPMCIASYMRLVESYNSFFPGYTKEVIIINAPRTFHLLVESLRPVLPPSYSNTLKVFDTNNKSWKNYLDTRVDPKYLPSEFSGTKAGME